MYITLILFLIGFLLRIKNILSQTSKFFSLESYKSVDLRGPTFKLLIEGFLNRNFSFSRFMVSGFFGREVSSSGAQFLMYFFEVTARSILSAGILPSSGFRVSDFFGRKVRGSFRFYSTLEKNTVKQLHPFFVTGLADGESTFYLGISKSASYKVGWKIIPTFSIELHSKDSELLGRI